MSQSERLLKFQRVRKKVSQIVMCLNVADEKICTHSLAHLSRDLAAVAVWLNEHKPK